MRFVICLPLTPNGSGCPSGSGSCAPCPCTPLAFHLGSPPLSPVPWPPGRLCSCSGTQPLSCPDVGTPTPLFPLAVPVIPSSSCTLIASLSFPLACELLRGRDCALRGPRLSKAQDDLVSIRFSGLVWCPSAPDCHRGHLLTHGVLSSTPGPGSILPPPRRGRGGAAPFLPLLSSLLHVPRSHLRERPSSSLRPFPWHSVLFITVPRTCVIMEHQP